MKIHRNEKGEIHRTSGLPRKLEEFPNELENPPNFAQKVDIFVKKTLNFSLKNFIKKHFFVKFYFIFIFCSLKNIHAIKKVGGQKNFLL